MKTFIVQNFTFPSPLKGISQKNIDEHLKLYEGYVKNANSTLAKIEELKKDSTTNAYLIGELFRRFSFEYNGMRNHELYFNLLRGSREITKTAGLYKLIEETWGSFDNWLTEFKLLGLTRGIGWAMLYYDRTDKRLINSWVDEQHLGQLNNCTPILGMDMWEHSYVFDYQPSGKKQYIEDFFANIDWSQVEENFTKAEI